MMDMVLDWLLEEEDPSVRALAMRDLLRYPGGNRELKAARKAAHERGPIAHVLDAMDPEGFWVKPGPGYGPKYRSTVWALILLAQLGASVEEDERVRKGCVYLVDHALAEGGKFSASTTGVPSYTIDCLQGNLLRALVELGYEDPLLDEAYEWMARSVTSEGVAPKEEKHAPVRYYVYKCGPDFACGANYGQPCAWGAVKVMLAFASLPPERRTPLIDRAIQRGVDFLFSVDLTTAGWPSGPGKAPNRDWWKFGFPVFYITDLLQAAEALTELGYASDARLAPLIRLIRDKQDDQGRWALEYDYAGKTWRSYGKKGEPNKWVTLRALRVLKRCGG